MIDQSLEFLVVCNMAKADGVPTWNKTDNAKLAELFRKGPGRGGISSQDTSVNTAKKILLQFFLEHCKPDVHKAYKSFGPLFQEQARAWNLNKRLEGACHERALGKQGKFTFLVDCCSLYVGLLILTESFVDSISHCSSRKDSRRGAKPGE